MFTGPNIKKDNLVLHLDASNPKSYPGSGTTWYDLSTSGNNATLVSSPVFNSNNSSSFLSFNGSVKKATIASSIGSSSYLTLSTWYRRDDNDASTSWRTLAATSSTNIHHLSFHSTTRNLGLWDGSFKDFGFTPPTDGSFYNYTVVYNSSVNALLYVNGEYESTVTTSLNLTTNPIGTIGNWTGNNYWAGHINSIAIFTRALTAEEVLQNYNATKSRFKL